MDVRDPAERESKRERKREREDGDRGRNIVTEERQRWE